MDVHIYNVLFELIVLLIVFGHTTSNTKTIEMCRDCGFFTGCGTCNAELRCDIRTHITITTVEYRDSSIPCLGYFTNCGGCCYIELQINTKHKNSIKHLCNDQPICNLDLWNPKKEWKMRITYVCNVPSTVESNTTTTAISKKETTATLTTQPSGETTNSSSPHTETRYSSSSTTVKSSSHSPEQSTDLGRIVKTKEETSAGFPLGDTIAIPVGIVVMILLIVGLVCVVRRRSHGTQKGRTTNKSTLPMQDMTANNNDNPPRSGNREHQQENHEQDYVDTTTHEGINTTDDDEYNTLNTHQAPVQIYPSYDHLPKDSHTTVDETYSHVTDSQTTAPDVTFSHLQDSKSNASNNVKRNQNNLNNVYNHVNRQSVDDNVYNNTETNFTQNLTSNLSQTRAAEDDYDHTDWNQAKYQKPIASRNGATVGDNITEDEYAVVNKRSDDTVEGNDGHNYFVLEKKSLKTSTHTFICKK